MRNWTIRTFSEDETVQAGMDLAAQLHGVVLLHGDLGAGKTTLVRGIVAGIPGTHPEEVSSPTFTLIHDYGAGVFHIDLYRLDRDSQIDTLGLDEIFDQARLVLIEWGEKLGRRTPPDRTEIVLEQPGDRERLIRITEWEGTDAAGTGTT
jgi:tRNA threonylcarbamoyladenosine biosynthesis protein TsaE